MRRLFVIALSILLVLSLFVSCTVEVNDAAAGTVSLRFLTDENEGTRSLSSSKTEFNAAQYYWYYTAEKSDPNTPSSGATSAETSVGEEGKLTSSVGPFSYGKWNFTLYGYTQKTGGTLVYKGTVQNAEIDAESQSISILVEPVKTSGGTGTLVIKNDIKFTSNDVEYTANASKVTSVVSGVYTEDEKAIGDGRTLSLASGVYKVEVSYKATESSVEYSYATNTIYVNVWNALTTTISGTLEEGTKYTKFVAQENSVITESGEKTISFGYSPASPLYSTTNTLGTTVTGNFTLTAEGVSGSLSLIAFDEEAVGSDAFQSDYGAGIASGKKAVAALDLTLTGAGFGIVNGIIETATVSTYIKKGLLTDYLSLNHIKADGTVASLDKVDSENDVQKDKFYYDSTTGKLVYSADSFGSFVVSYPEVVTSKAPSDTQVGETLIMGKIPETDETYGGQDIAWKVLDVDEESKRALVISEKILTEMQHQEDYSAYTWSNSKIRTWLNNEEADGFILQYGLSEVVITAITHETDLNGTNESTTDKVFLLSSSEASSYFTDSTARIAFTLDDIWAAGAYWWLRSRGSDSSDNVPACVSGLGDLTLTGYGAYARFGVRPAFWVNMEGAVNYDDYSVGETGPAGGYVFYDAGSVQTSTYWDSEKGEEVKYQWRMLEVAPENINSHGTSIVFGYYRPDGSTNTLVVNNVDTEITKDDIATYNNNAAIGQGRYNTTMLVKAMGTAAYSSDSDSSTTENYAAKLCDSYSYGSYVDWFLPSAAEVWLIYQNLYQKSIGEISSNSSFWSSSEYSAGTAWRLSLIQEDPGVVLYNVIGMGAGDIRAVRAF